MGIRDKENKVHDPGEPTHIYPGLYTFSFGREIEPYHNRSQRTAGCEHPEKNDSSNAAESGVGYSHSVHERPSYPQRIGNHVWDVGNKKWIHVGSEGDSRVVASRNMRQFETGATRNQDLNKLDFEGFLCPLVLERYAEYMNKNRVQADGTVRESDNWQKGIPDEAYVKSLWRHFKDVWKNHRGYKTDDDFETACCAVMFNVMGLLHEKLKAKTSAK